MTNYDIKSTELKVNIVPLNKTYFQVWVYNIKSNEPKCKINGHFYEFNSSVQMIQTYKFREALINPK